MHEVEAQQNLIWQIKPSYGKGDRTPTTLKRKLVPDIRNVQVMEINIRLIFHHQRKDLVRGRPSSEITVFKNNKRLIYRKFKAYLLHINRKSEGHKATQIKGSLPCYFIVFCLHSDFPVETALDLLL